MRFTHGLAAAVTLLAACHRSEPCCGPVDQNGLTGSWRLTLVAGGFAGVHIEVPKDSAVLTLSSDSSFHVFHDWRLISYGSYHLTDTPVYSSTPQPAIVFGIGGRPTRYQVSHDSLILGEDFDDDFVQVYVRVH